MLNTRMTLEEATARLARVGQEHVLRFFKDLPATRQQELLKQIGEIDLEALPGLIEQYVKQKPEFRLPERLSPAPYYPLDVNDAAKPWDRAAARTAGEQLVKKGKVGCFTVAGGQGSRLGFDGPKGCFPGGAVTGKPLFAIFAEGIMSAERRCGGTVPWYIMTSPLNHEATVSFFRDKRFFGLDPKSVLFFPQGVMPSLEMGTGRMILAEKHEIATNPDGHGGALRALWESGAIADMKRRGVEHISYFQVDNPLVRAVDPVFLGLHATAADSSGEMSSKMLPKVSAEEKVGVFCVGNGRTMIIEYSDMPAALASERLTDGTLRFIAGSPAIHVLGVGFIEKLNSDPAFAMPFHRAEKKVPYIDEKGLRVEPHAANGVKLERFVFDAIPFCRKSIVVETSRADEFAPIKNATGADSVESSRRIQTARVAAWLESVGVEVPRGADGEPDCVLEISPLTAWGPQDLAGKNLPKQIERGAKVAM